MPDHGHLDPGLLAFPTCRRLDFLQRQSNLLDLRHPEVVVLESQYESICGEHALVGVEQVGFSKRVRSVRLIRVEERLSFALRGEEERVTKERLEVS